MHNIKKKKLYITSTRIAYVYNFMKSQCTLDVIKLVDNVKQSLAEKYNTTHHNGDIAYMSNLICFKNQFSSRHHPAIHPPPPPPPVL